MGSALNRVYNAFAVWIVIGRRPVEIFFLLQRQSSFGWVTMQSLSLTAFFGARLDKSLNKMLDRRSFDERRIRKFRDLAQFLQLRSPYYARIIADRGIDPARCHPQDFPMLTKSDVIKHFDNIVTNPKITKQSVEEFLARSHDANDRLLGRYIVVHSSGTTGELGYFVYSNKEWSWGLASLAELRGLGLLAARRRRVAFIGATAGHLAGISIMSALRSPLLWPLFRFESYDVNSSFRGVVDGLNAFQPHILVGYGLGLATLAERQLDGRLAIRPKIISNSGEAISKVDRERIEAAFGVGVRNVYTSSEHMVMAAQEPGSQTMRLFEDDLIFEPSESHTLVTNLFNRTFPLIRYRMGDAIEVVAESDLHAPHKMIREIPGRAEQAPVFVNKYGELDWISPHMIYSFMVENLRRHQLVQTSESAFVFSVVLEPALNLQERRRTVAEISDRLTAILAQKSMENVGFRIEEVKEISVDPKTGKFSMIRKSRLIS